MNEVLKKFIEQLGIDVAKATEELRGYATKYPDAAERAAAIEAFIKANATVALDPVALSETLAGIAHDIATGQTGVDPDAWAGSG